MRGARRCRALKAVQGQDCSIFVQTFRRGLSKLHKDLYVLRSRAVLGRAYPEDASFPLINARDDVLKHAES